MMNLEDIITIFNKVLDPHNTWILHKKVIDSLKLKVYKTFNYSLYKITDTNVPIVEQEYTQRCVHDQVQEISEECDKKFLSFLIQKLYGTYL